MAGETKNDVAESVTSTDTADTEIKKTKKKKGVLSRLWNALFRVRDDDFEKRLQHISKEEAAVLSRITRRSHTWRRITRHFIIFSVLFEVVAVGYAIITTRSLDLNWQMRALQVLPMFLLSLLCFITYSVLRSFTKMLITLVMTCVLLSITLTEVQNTEPNMELVKGDRKDHTTLDNLRAERQAKIDELKEKTNYYITQQLIQRYDPDPAAKAAAASVLASKLGADSGLKVYLGDDSTPLGKSSDVEVAPPTSGLRQRKQQSLSKASSIDGGTVLHHEEGMLSQAGLEGMDVIPQHQMVVEHHPQAGLSAQDGGWIARLAALLVGEDPTQSYALICGNCHMHNGLARKEDFPYVTYYCPHCNALNRSRQSDDRISGLSSPALPPMAVVGGAPNSGGSTPEKVSPSSTPVAAAEISES